MNPIIHPFMNAFSENLILAQTLATRATLGVSALLPFLLMFSGMALGFSALRDIRAAGGRLGGATAAVLAVGLLPSILIIALCISGVSLATEPPGPFMHQRLPLARCLGLAAGCWLSFLMMRSWHRQATGWEPTPANQVAARSGTGTAALVLTIIGAVLVLLLATAREPRWFPGLEEGPSLLLLLGVLVGGLVCGVLARREPAGRTCAWLSGTLLLIVLLTSA